MKTLVIVYSRTGWTLGVGREIARSCGNMLREIQDVRSRKGFFGFLRSIQDARKNRTPPIKPLSIDVSDFDLVVLGAPVWAGHVAAPMRTFVEQNKNSLRRIAVFCTMGRTGADAALSELAQAVGLTPVAQLALSDTEIRKSLAGEKIGRFIRAIEAADATAAAVSRVPAQPQHVPFFAVTGRSKPDADARKGQPK